MGETKQLILGEFSRRIDERYRLSLPSEFLELFQPKDGDCIIAKERPGCLSLWEHSAWQEKLDARVELIQQRIKLGDLEQKMPQLQMFGRLLSTRHRPVQLAGRGRLLIPEGFREFLGVEPEKEVMVVGAAVCLEIWRPQKWIAYVEGRMPKFRKLLDTLSH
ncbi:MAG: division/cell wall cluster transcriptional repressor MraZ [Planctomycetaceae bacterium]|jgi:MraZ protein|nr:division/cell wall cluster transcriptional repressor MraZ [Planctomycetaceae bacterium]